MDTTVLLGDNEVLRTRCQQLECQLADQADELGALYTCSCLLLGNWPKGRFIDAVLLPGLAVDNWQENQTDDGMLHTAARLAEQCPAARLAIPGNEGTFLHGPDQAPSPTGYPGYRTWCDALQALGVAPSRIVPYASEKAGPDGKSWNTRTEADDFVSVARTHCWNDIVVLCTPFHLLRVLLTLVKACLDGSYRPYLRPVTPRSVCWTRLVYHSQGLQQLPRTQHIAEEWNRIPPYQRNGSLCTFRQLAAYLLSQHQ